MLNWLARVLFLLVIPFYLVNLGIESHYKLKFQNDYKKASTLLEEAIDPLIDFHEDPVFFHNLLQKEFRKADSKNAPAQLKRNLKKIFRGKIKQIFWDKNGKIIKSLTDEKKFAYILKKWFEGIKTLEKHFAETFPPTPGQIPSLQKNLKLFRSYIGSFLPLNLLCQPFYEAHLGSALSVSVDKDKGFLWFQSGKNFTFCCQISQEFKGKNIGARYIVNRTNRSRSLIKLGFFLLPDYTPFGLAKTDQIPFKLEAINFFKSTFSLQENENYLIHFRLASPRILLFSYLQKKNFLTPYEIHKNKWLFLLASIFSVLIFIFYCYSLTSGAFSLKIKTRLWLLLLFANGLPLIILISTSLEYFQFKQQSLVNQTHSESIRILKDFDSRLPMTTKSLADRLNRKIKDLESACSRQVWDQTTLAEMESFVTSLNPSEFALLGENKQIFVSGGSSLEDKSRLRLVTYFSKILEAINKSNKIMFRYSDFDSQGFTNEEDFLYELMHDFGKISPRHVGSDKKWIYIQILRTKSKDQAWSIFCCSWDVEAFQRTFLNEELKKFNQSIKPGKIIVMEKATEMVFPDFYSKNKNLKRLLHRVISRKFAFKDSLEIDGAPFVAAAMTGANLTKAVLLHIYPSSELISEIDSLRNRMFGIILLIVFIAFLMLARFSNTLLSPIRKVESGIKAISERNFRFQIPSPPNDEYGDLMKAMNTALEGMSDLAVANSVQNGLLPDCNYKNDQIEIFAKSIFMTKMGGDYFDYFIENGKALIIFGDVAGHGVPAAILMSMVKAVFANIDFEISTSDLIYRCNEVFLHLKKKGWNRMMTLICMELDLSSGDFRMANAGQCFPIHLKNDSQSAEYIKVCGMPLGVKIKRPSTVVSGTLAPNDYLFFYSDGIVEAMNLDGEQFGFERLQKEVQQSKSENLEKFWKNVYSAHEKWAPNPDDDVSILILRRLS